MSDMQITVLSYALLENEGVTDIDALVGYVIKTVSSLGVWTVKRSYYQLLTLHEAVKKYNHTVTNFPEKLSKSVTRVVEHKQKMETYLNNLKKAEIFEKSEFLVFFEPGSNDENVPEEILDDYFYAQFSKLLPKFQKISSEVDENINVLVMNLIAIEQSFEGIRTSVNFAKVEESCFVIISMGKILHTIAEPPDFTPRTIRDDQLAAIRDNSVKSIVRMIIPAISILISKLTYLKTKYNNLEEGNDRNNVKIMIADLLDVFDQFNIVIHHPLYKNSNGLSSLAHFPDFIEQNYAWYQEEMMEVDHINYSGYIGKDPIIASICLEQREQDWVYRVVIRTKDGTIKKLIPFLGRNPNKWAGTASEVIIDLIPSVEDLSPLSRKNSISRDIIEYDNKDLTVSRTFKFGILLCKPGQISEEEMFSNTSGSVAYENFLPLIGKQTTSLGFDRKFTGGLDVKGGSTGEHLLFEDWNGYQLIYHVSTFLPHSKGNSQQLHKKRHIGNDISMIVFQEEGSEPFEPSTIVSNYLQNFIIVRVLRNEGTPESTYYRVSVVQKSDVPDYDPPLPYPPIFKHGRALRDWLIKKLINSELAAYRSKLMKAQFRPTFKTHLNEFAEKAGIAKKTSRKRGGTVTKN